MLVRGRKITSPDLDYGWQIVVEELLTRPSKRGYHIKAEHGPGSVESE